MYVLGTAGHVDHGKSSFLRCLTSMEPDRLPDEKKKGMTIQLNFVWIELEGGQRVGIVDVPGHKKFVKNMITGVMHIDAFLFVVAADDGWMPQSEEHLQVLTSMGVTRGLVVLTKTDLVEPEVVDARKTEVADRIEQALGQRPEVYSFSAPTGTGLNEIRQGVGNLVKTLEPPRNIECGRLWVDRVFLPQGVGVVVTGTLRDGSVKIGDELSVLPSGKIAQVKGLQSYQNESQNLDPVCRAAIQLGKIQKEDIGRGSLLQATKKSPVSSVFDARLHFFKPTKAKNTELNIHFGTSRVKGLVIPMEKENNSSDHWVRIKTESPIPVSAGDRFVVRANETVAGGTVVEPCRVQRSHKQALFEFKRWEDSVVGFVSYRLGKQLFVNETDLWNESRYSRQEIENVLEALKTIPLEEGFFGLAKTWESIQKASLKALQEAHDQKRDGLSEGELAGSLGLEAQSSGLVCRALIKEGSIEKTAQGYRVTGHEVELDDWEKEFYNNLKAAFSQLGGKPINLKESLGDSAKIKGVLSRLVKQNAIIHLGEDHYLLSEDFSRFQNDIVTYLKEQGSAKTTALREKLDLSRRQAVLLLEFLDKKRVTFLKDGIRKLLK